MKSILFFITMFLKLCVTIRLQRISAINRSRLYSSVSQPVLTSTLSTVRRSPLKPKVVFILGGPGAGKGTQCELLSSEFGMIHLSAGELLRAERQSGSSNGSLIENYLKEGKIVPVQITLDLLKAAMAKANANRFLVDGFPRNWDNIQGWESSMMNECDVEAVIFIDCPESVLESRILNRGLTSGRSDDNLDTIRKRFLTYKESTLPIVEYYEKSDKLIRVSGAETREAVFETLKAAMLPHINREVLEMNAAVTQLYLSQDWTGYMQLCSGTIDTVLDTPEVT